MINRQALLADLQKFLQRIEADLLERSESTEAPEVPAALHAEYEQAAKAERTAQNYEDWRTDTITQAAAAWVLSCVFVRFLEDNSLIDPPKIAGPGERLARARDEYELYFRSHPKHTDREYLLSVFGELAKLPGTKDIFSEHNAINDLPNWLSGDAAGELLNFFQKIDATSGDLVHDFTDPNWDTRFLGDLYQDLSEAARKKFALLQTPDFVEEFILDRTLEPAIEEFGLVPQPSGREETSATRFKMIDPACGSGHFLLGAFARLLERWQRKEPGTNIRELIQRALDSIHGVDINPFAVAIAKFRILLASIKACGITKLDKNVPGFRINVVCGDSLLHGENRSSTGQELMDFADGATDQELYSHSYPGEDLQSVRIMLRPGSFHCVVANPPYIVPKDRKLNDWYRKRFSACHMKYSLAVPFMQQVFQLAVDGGFTGQITANSFMKREFGKKLIESFIPTIDLTHVIDMSGAYIPGHGTPTTILFGRNRQYVGDSIRTVLGIRGEPAPPSNPSEGFVWKSILALVDRTDASNEFVSSGDSDRSLFHRHPWSIGGGGAAELKEQIDGFCNQVLSELATSIGITCFTLADDFFFLPLPELRRRGIPSHNIKEVVVGDAVRDWAVSAYESILFPYDENFQPLEDDPDHPAIRSLWTARTPISNSKMFGGKTKVECGLKWYEYGRLTSHKLKTPLSITFANVATHNHFVLDHGGRIFECHAPIIKLKEDLTEKDQLHVTALLNSSIACFWMQQTMHNKGGPGGGSSKDEKWHDFFEFSGTRLNDFPLPQHYESDLGILIDECSRMHQSHLPSSLTSKSILTRNALDIAKTSTTTLFGQMVALQEELDWACYYFYGLTESALTVASPPALKVGERAFEIAMARKMQRGELQTEWFPWLGCTPITNLPPEWPEEYRKVVAARIKLIEEDPNLGLIEQPNCKRRWEMESWESKLERALREWLLLRIETYFDFDDRMTDTPNSNDKLVSPLEIAVYSVAQLADTARQDRQFMEVGEIYRDDPAFDVQALVEELLLAESVPHLPILRYKDSGLRKRAEWEKTWDLQRREDAGESVGTIPVPPKYTSADFISTGRARYWALRGKLDVPKERWISFPHCEGPDGTLIICWAGYDHLQQAQAISAYYVRVQTEFGGSDDPRLIPLLASLIELLPWLKQWHNDPNANFDGLRMGDYFEGFVNEEARNLGKTLAEIKAWLPSARTATRGRRKTT